VIAISEVNKEFISLCRAKSRLSIDDALKIAEAVGLFSDNDVEIIAKGKKQKIRELFSNVCSNGERVFRSIELENGRCYVDLENPENGNCIDLLIGGEFRNIAKSKSRINSLKKVSRNVIPGQIALDEIHLDAL